MPTPPFFEWLAGTEAATAINQAPYLIGALSSVHLVGLTLILGSTIVSCMRYFEILLPEQPLAEVMKPAGKAVVLGFAISLATGLLMFAPRAATAVKNSAFQIKMILLLAAVIFHFALYRYALRTDSTRPPMLRLMGFLGVALWFGVSFAACVFAIFD